MTYNIVISMNLLVHINISILCFLKYYTLTINNTIHRYLFAFMQVMYLILTSTFLLFTYHNI